MTLALAPQVGWCASTRTRPRWTSSLWTDTPSQSRCPKGPCARRTCGCRRWTVCSCRTASSRGTSSRPRWALLAAHLHARTFTHPLPPLTFPVWHPLSLSLAHVRPAGHLTGRHAHVLPVHISSGVRRHARSIRHHRRSAAARELGQDAGPGVHGPRTQEGCQARRLEHY